jgi:hypothetical protein
MLMLQRGSQTHCMVSHTTLCCLATIASLLLAHLRDIVDVPIEINGTEITSGSFDFVENALVFHKTTDELLYSDIHY